MNSGEIINKKIYHSIKNSRKHKIIINSEGLIKRIFRDYPSKGFVENDFIKQKEKDLDELINLLDNKRKREKKMKELIKFHFGDISHIAEKERNVFTQETIERYVELANQGTIELQKEIISQLEFGHSPLLDIRILLKNENFDKENLTATELSNFIKMNKAFGKNH